MSVNISTLIFILEPNVDMTKINNKQGSGLFELDKQKSKDKKVGIELERIDKIAIHSKVFYIIQPHL